MYKSLLSQFASDHMESKPSPLRAFSDFMAKLFVEEDAVEKEDDPPLRAFSDSMAALFVEEYDPYAPGSDDESSESMKGRTTEAQRRYKQVSSEHRKTELMRRYRDMQVRYDLQAKPHQTDAAKAE